MEQKINMNISEGDSFYAHQASINFSPTMMFLDFKNVTPRVDERSRQGPTLVLKHNLIMMDPHHITLFRDLLTKVIIDYEKEFGKIKKPEAIAKAEKKNKANRATGTKSTKKNETDVPNYFG